ncbi:replication-relaxation family protein (plasmid) [Pontibacillus sp. ALD_SL1]|uniref:replication-relaxation family protein n=1 Tax=Pontibacillus sp. ALD_SL1 TaxID=2777185 RepID=UPI001A959A48|nr:replication-relaxation family protein [Pontibacillus sp. ALD_SL1]QST02849.1 replication-relaxation family protein [Pontibacillus sp. ALD_SL1]
MKREKRERRMLLMMGTIPIVSTTHIASLFEDTKHPNKRASEGLRRLEREGLVEGKDRELGKTKVWRLSPKGKKMLGVSFPTLRLTSRTVDHVLAVADVYTVLSQSHDLHDFMFEPRSSFTDKKGKKRNYCPDAFFVWKGNPYFLEVQRTKMSRTYWSKKWSTVNLFVEGGHMRASLFREYDRIPVLTLSQQQEETITFGATVPVLCYSSIHDFMLETSQHPVTTKKP